MLFGSNDPKAFSFYPTTSANPLNFGPDFSLYRSEMQIIWSQTEQLSRRKKKQRKFILESKQMKRQHTGYEKHGNTSQTRKKKKKKLLIFQVAEIQLLSR